MPIPVMEYDHTGAEPKFQNANTGVDNTEYQFW